MSKKDPAPSFEQIRRRNGVSIEQIANQTKINTAFLRAIECEDFGKLPGGVFDTSYIRQYSAAIGLSADGLLERYAAHQAQKAEEDAQQNPCVRRSWSVRSLIKSLLGIPSPLPRY